MGLKEYMMVYMGIRGYTGLYMGIHGFSIVYRGIQGYTGHVISTGSCGACWGKNWGELVPFSH